MFSRRVPDLGEPNAWALRLEQRRRSGAALIDLTESNPTRVGLTVPSGANLMALADPAAARYQPDARGGRAAREAIVEYYRSRGAVVASENVVLTSGTSEAYAHLLRLLCDPGDEVLAPRPSYPLFEPLAALEGVRLGAYRLAYDGRWHLDRDSLERATGSRTRAVIVVEPNHPTGTCLDTGDRDFLTAHCERRGLSLISDEVFGDFSWSQATLPSLLAKPRALTFVLGGISKVCGLPQMKLSWIAAAGPAPERDRALAGLEWIADLFLSVSDPVQLALPRWLEGRDAFQSRVRERIATNRERLAGLAARRPEIDRLAAEGGWVAALRFPARRTEEEWALALLDHDVIVHPAHFYDFSGEASCVVSLIVEPERFAAGLERLEAVLAEPT